MRCLMARGSFLFLTQPQLKIMAGIQPSSGGRDSFGSKLGVLAAAAGSAVGLGNIWKFPYEAGQNGGAAFLFVYIGFIIAIGVPVMLAEFLVGRRAQANPFGAFKKLAPKSLWYLVGVMGVAVAFMIMAFYGSVAGWTLEYIYRAAVDGFAGKSTEEFNSSFNSFISHPYRPVIWQLLFMVMSGFIVLSGVKNGIEKYSKILMPILLVLIIVMTIRSVTLPGASEGLKFIFQPDFSKLNGKAILSALGQAFFSLSLGMGTLITYGSYIQKKENLPSMAASVALADTLIAVLAGVAIFPAVFAFQIDPAAGPGLVFVTLPNVFQQMPGGYFFGLLFFLLLTVAALTSAISLLEVVVSYFGEELNIGRKKATIIAVSIISVLGVFATLSFGPLADVKLFGKTIFDTLDFTSSKIMLPLGGMFISIFVGWVLGKKVVTDEITNGGLLKIPFIHVFLFILKFIAPIAIALVFLQGTGLVEIVPGASMDG